jgi:Bacterial transcriptional activator domain
MSTSSSGYLQRREQPSLARSAGDGTSARTLHGRAPLRLRLRLAGGELRRLRAIHVDLLEQVGRGRLAAGEPNAALEAGERGLAIDVLNEGLWRLALEAENALGLREAVAERYEQLRALLDERLGLEPARETRLLHRRLLGQR